MHARNIICHRTNWTYLELARLLFVSMALFMATRHVAMCSALCVYCRCALSPTGRSAVDACYRTNVFRSKLGELKSMREETAPEVG